MKNKGGSFKS